MMRSQLAGLGLAALVAASPCAARDRSVVDAAFGNTIVSTYPDGRTGELWLHPDGSYSAEGRRHDLSNGHWKLKGDKLCLKQSRPLPVPFSYCTPVAQGAVGASWTGKAVSGEAIRIRLVRGRFDPATRMTSRGKPLPSDEG